MRFKSCTVFTENYIFACSEKIGTLDRKVDVVNKELVLARYVLDQGTVGYHLTYLASLSYLHTYN